MAINVRHDFLFLKVSSAALANAALVLSSKVWTEMLKMGGAASEHKSEKPWAYISLHYHAGIEATLARAQFSFAGALTIEIKIEQNVLNTKVASAKEAFDTFQFLVNLWPTSRVDPRSHS